MFSIRFCLAGDNHILQKLSATDFEKEYSRSDIPGFVEMRFGVHTIGFCPETPVHPEIMGPEQVDWWLHGLLEILQHFENSGAFGAFYLLNHPDTWLVFCKNHDAIIINEGFFQKANPANRLFLWEMSQDFCWREPAHQIVCYSHFKKEVLSFGREFLAELHSLNPQLDRTDFVTDLLEKLEYFS
ncbi:MAG: hypothetical protein IIX70_00475 [Oscillospiraceae bacterium]|nr:hypothetical protein [Oscillospiraceae bacterium]